MSKLGAFSKLSKPVDEISTSNRVKPGAYEFQLTDITHLNFGADHKSMPNQQADVFELTVIDGDNESEFGKKYSAFMRYPDEEEQGVEKADTFASILKGFMLSLGIPESHLEDWDSENPDDTEALIGNRYTGRIAINKKNKEFDNLYNLTLVDDDESGASDTDIETNVGAWKS